MTEIQVRTDADPGDIVFDIAETPFLTFGHHPRYGDVWTLNYMEVGGNGVEDYIIAGRRDDVDAVLEDARAHLVRVGYTG